MPTYTTLSSLPSTSTLADANLMLVTASVAGTPTSESATLLTLKNYVLGGTAATATKLATPRTINGVAFDGSANIVISADISTQNAASATKLATARTINGVSFDGTANITIPAGSVVFSSITSLPTTVAGFGITDGATLTGTQTLTNKTLTAPNISSIVNTGTLTLPTSTDTLVGRNTTDTLTNKSISGANNTLTAIPNSALTNSSFVLNGTTVNLGDTKTITTVLSNALTIGAGLSGGSFNGTSAVTIYVSPADASNIGGVRVPAVGTSGITNSSGTIGLALATTTQVGGVFVDGTSITAASGIITANAGGLSGTTLKSTVVNSSLTSVGTLSSLTVSGTTTLATSLTGLLKSASGVVSNATAGTDYIAPPSGTALLKANNGGALANAVAGTDYLVDVPITNRYYVDPARVDTYTATGTQQFPFLTISAAMTVINARISAGYNTSVNPIYIVLKGSVTDNFTITNGRVYIVGEGGGIHAPIYITGTGSTPTITVSPTSGDLTSNRFSLLGVSVVGASGQNAVYVTGSAPLRMFMQDVWITANATTVGAGYYQDNTGTGTIANADSLKLSQNGSGDVYCIQIIHGTASFNAVETSGATQVAAVGSGATLTINASELDANGDINCETYGNGSLTITNSVITNAAVNGNGIKVNGTNSTVILGNCIFTILPGTGKVINNVQSSATNIVAYAGVVFTTGYNTTIDATFTLVPQSIATGNIVNSTLASPIVTTGVVAGSSTLAVFNTTATTINEFGAATTINRGGVGVTEYIGKNTGNSTVSILGNGSGGTATLTTNVTSGTVNLFAGAQNISVGAGSGNTTVNNNLNVTGTLKQNGIVVPNLITMLAYQLAL